MVFYIMTSKILSKHYIVFRYNDNSGDGESGDGDSDDGSEYNNLSNNLGSVSSQSDQLSEINTR